MKPWYSLLRELFLGSSLGFFGWHWAKLLVVTVAIALPVKAQITVDGTTNTNLTPIDNGIRIDGGNRAEGNLFHSFSEFSVLNGTEAFFNNPSDIVNIFSRVTGDKISNIDGLIRANGTANLFLLNPAGIIFGENAQLDIGGSFLSSTANSMVFADGKLLATDGDNTPLLTINMPIGLNFGNNPGKIAVSGSNLQVNNGEALALLGGEIIITGGKITALGGSVELGGVAQQGQIIFSQKQSGKFGNFDSISFPEGVARADMTLTNDAEVDVRAAGGGSISVNARNIKISGGELGASNLFAGIAPESGSPEAQAGDISLNATDNITVTQGSRISNNVEESGVGNAGVINITTANLSLTNGGRVQAETLGQGNAGLVEITAKDTITFDGEDSDGFTSAIFSLVDSGAEGDTGGVTINTGSLTLTNGGIVFASTGGQGNAGAIIIKASETISADGGSQAGLGSAIVSQVRNTGKGDAGGINITTANLSLTNGGIVTASTAGQGNAGVIIIKASETISADGESQAGFRSAVVSQVRNTGKGDAGEIEITTANLSLTNGGILTASTFGQGNGGAITIEASGTISADGESQAAIPSGIYSTTVGDTRKGDAGEIEITTANLSLTQGGIVNASTFGQGNGGAITIEASGTIFAEGESQDGFPSGIFSTVQENGVGNASGVNINTNNLYLTNNAEISAESLGQGNASNISIQANSLTLENGASLLASTPVGKGGNITLQIADDLILRDSSTISAEALEDADGGNITIDAEFVIAFPNQNNDIIARAAQGIGGNIEITTRGIFGIEERSSTPLNKTNDLDTSSQFGLDGTIAINQLDVNPAETLAELPTEVIDVTGLVAQNLCQKLKGSEFIVTGKGGIAPNPSEVRDGELVEVDLVEPAPFEEVEKGRGERRLASKEVKAEIVEAQGWIINDRGNVELVAHKTDLNSSPTQPKDDKSCY